MILDRFKLEGKVAVITGAGRGIGAGCARAFAEAGADIVGGARTLDQVETVAEEIRAMGRRALAVRPNRRPTFRLRNSRPHAYELLGPFLQPMVKALTMST